jgi:hypothetical protein
MLATLRRAADRIKAELAMMTRREPEGLTRLRRDPAAILTTAGLTPDHWQTDLLRCPSRRMLLLCGALVLLLSPTLRQSKELFKTKFMTLYNATGRLIPPTKENALELELANGSRVVALPGEEGSIRSFSSVNLLVVDEAARVPDDLYRAVRPMLAVSKGRLVVLSTPFGKRGFFYDEWVGRRTWKRVEIRAEQCTRISADFLAEERQAIGERWYRQEYECSFEDVIDAVFAESDIRAALSSAVKPLFG